MLYKVDTDRKIILVNASAVPPAIKPFAFGHLNGWDIFRHNDADTLLLKKSMKLPIKMPVECYYNFPHPDFEADLPQVHMTTHCVSRKRAFVWGDIGVGKTIISVWAHDWASQHQGVRQTLVVAPKSSLYHTWKRAFFKATPQYTVTVLEGSTKSKLKKMYGTPSHVYITNFETMNRLQEEILATNWDLVIFDEHTRLQSKTSKPTVVMRALDERPNVRMWLLSGEPEPNSPMNLYWPAKLVCGARMPYTQKDYESQTMVQSPDHKFVKWPRRGWQEKIHEWLKGYVVQYRLEDVMDIEATVYDTAPVQSTIEQEKMWSALKDDKAVRFDDGFVAVRSGAIGLNKGLQIGSGILIYEQIENTDRHVKRLKSNKFDDLEDFIARVAGPVIVYVPYVDAIDYVSEWMTKKKITHEVIKGGDGSLTRRTEIFDKFQDGKLDVLLASPAAMQYSITLTASNHIYWFGLVPDNEIFSQANGRIIRRGQTKVPYIRIPITNKSEHRVFHEILMPKIKGQKKLLNQFNISELKF